MAYPALVLALGKRTYEGNSRTWFLALPALTDTLQKVRILGRNAP